MILILLTLKTPEADNDFFTDNDNKFLCRKAGEKSVVLLTNVTDIFDGICDEEKNLHFAIETLDGSLIYLKNDGTTWRKYIIFKSKSMKPSIFTIHLSCIQGKLCAFYIMEHNDQCLLVKHTFSADNLYGLPEVLDTTDQRKDMDICYCPDNTLLLFYRNSAGERKEKKFGRSFHELPWESDSLEPQILTLKAINNGIEILITYTCSKKGYTALVFKNYTKQSEPKIITFGIAKNCNPILCADKGEITLQWDEGAASYQSVSHDFGNTFSKPTLLRGEGTLHRLRSTENPCCLYQKETLYFSGKPLWQSAEIAEKKSQNLYGRRENSMTGFKNNTAKENYIFKDFEDPIFVLEKLQSIEKKVDALGEELHKICMQLDILETAKKNLDKNVYNVFPDNMKNPQTKAALSPEEDIGEKDEKNIALFNSMDVDEIDFKKSVSQQQ